MEIFQTQDQIVKIYKDWVRLHSHSVCPGYYDCNENRKLIENYIKANCENWYDSDTITSAVRDNRNRILLKSSEQTAAERAAKAAEEKKRQEDARIDQLVNNWGANHCPTGLLVGGNSMYPANVDLIAAYLRKNGGIITNETLNAAVETLSPSLIWFDRTPEAMEIRNLPPPPPRQLSRQARLDAGIEHEIKKGHSENKPTVTMAEVARKAKAIFDKEHGIDPESDYRAKAEMLSVGNHLGKLDHSATAQLRGIFAKNPDGTTNWKITYEKRNEAADNFERLKSRRR